MSLLHKAKAATYPFPPHRREYEDCKQILKLSLNPSCTLKPGQDFGRTSRQKTCPNGHKESEDCHSVSVPLRCTPTERQSSSIHNSLSLELKKCGLETEVFSSLQILRIPRFFLRTKSLHPFPRFATVKAIRLKLSITCSRLWPEQGNRQRAGSTSPESQ